MRVNVKKQDELKAMLDKVQSRSSKRNVDIDDIRNVINEIEGRFNELKVATSNIKSSVFIYENGYKMPASYNGQPESTQFRLERGAKDWFITGIYRNDCNHDRQITFVNEKEFKELFKF